jgi:putative nucleotidyltransferase with HDIG domain
LHSPRAEGTLADTPGHQSRSEHMSEQMPTRQQAWDLLNEYNKTDRTLKHALAVEAVMRHLAVKAGEDADKWGLAGLIHDLDFEAFPEQHCAKTAEILRGRGWPEEIVRAAVSHGWGICSDVKPVSRMEITLYAVDELTGLVSATALVRPSKSLDDLKAKSVRKKWKDRHFAAGVDRGVIEKGAEMLGVELSALIDDVIEGMKAVAAELGLAGAA